MTLCEELYFEIRITGEKSEVQKFIAFLKSGGLDEFFEILPEYFDYEDDYHEASPAKEVSVIFSNDDCGIPIDEFDTDEFLEAFCKRTSKLYLRGVLYDVDEDEYEFISMTGDSYYVNAKRGMNFGDDSDDDDDDDENYEKKYYGG